MFDLNVVSRMHRMGRLDRLIPSRSKVIPVASTTFLEELAGLYKADSRQFYQILDWYRSCTWGRLIKPWMLLVQREAENGKALSYSSALEPTRTFSEIFHAVSVSDFIATLDRRVWKKKSEIETAMNDAADQIRAQMKEHGDDNPEIKRTWMHWLRKTPDLIQNWGEHFFGSGCDYSKLPHLRAFFNCWYVKHYMAMTVGRRHRGSDQFDHGYYIESTTLGSLVTDDNNFRETVKLISGDTVHVYDETGWLNHVHGPN